MSADLLERITNANPFEFSIITTREQEFQLLGRFIQTAKVEILHIPGRMKGSDEFNIDYTRVIKETRKTTHKFLLSPLVLVNSSYVRSLLEVGAKMRVLSDHLEGFRMVIKDQKETMIVSVDSQLHQRNAVYCANEAFARSCSKIFSLIWETAQPVSG